ncbi:ABC transporter substrate-binding protein [Anaerotignum lactatifermentans]|uniref:ABC transporter substrate-binding protein n=1 Tax=Anaerotignum lactatifermentans TaxID=160404 RepID=A0ABS2G7X2_9FIRM|nr:ABC transporter substrate-binding protein [Anaerotignum lactatifermentans]MBM6828301.1 ABC transporter substrate-binding protein [Anaerotignum lactatifermentans]MBM6877581.1 ABC transporter substrate-binding protein [Anaerotignum lactatifermentans]MBM6949884.1 ABC transporter substrate-binding protein [Anaerotignum lactatifermentans]
MKKNWHRMCTAGLSTLLLLFSLNACTNTAEQTQQTKQTEDTQQIEASDTGYIAYHDAFDREQELTAENAKRVVALYGSFAEAWELAGGTLVGVTEDAIEERNMDLGEDVAMIGSVKEPNFEEIIALSPSLVILSADVATQVNLEPALQQASIPYAYFRVDTVEDYVEMMHVFSYLNGREDLYEQNAESVYDKVQEIKALVTLQPNPTGLLIRAFSTGAKAKGADNQTGVIMRDLGVDNIVARHDSLLEDLSIEEIITEDPDYIFITTMGSEQAALTALEKGIMTNPAWAGLHAVQQDKCYVLPKDLFHYKPNARWAESYAYMAKILYPNLTEEIDNIMAT